jgi:hypothetical protein
MYCRVLMADLEGLSAPYSPHPPLYFLLARKGKFLSVTLMDRVSGGSTHGVASSSIQDRANILNTLNLAQARGTARIAHKMEVTQEDLPKAVDKGHGFFKHLISSSRDAKRAIEHIVDKGDLNALQQLAGKGKKYRTLIASTLGSVLASGSWTGKRGASLAGTGITVSPEMRANAMKIFSSFAQRGVFKLEDIEHVFSKFPKGVTVDGVIRQAKEEASTTRLDDDTISSFRSIAKCFGKKKAPTEAGQKYIPKAGEQGSPSRPNLGDLQAAMSKVRKE